MKKSTLLRALALWMCLILTGTAALAEAPVADIAAPEAPVQEQPEFALTAADVAEADPAPAEEPAPAEPAPVEEPAPVDDGPTSVAAPEATAEEAQQPAAPAEDPNTRSFAQTATVETETWTGVDLVRADGFAGALAQVNGQLTLVNAKIDGKPAREADLAACFSLGPNGMIAIQDDAPLALSLSAFCLNKGSKKALSVRFNGAEVPAKKVKWATSDKKVAKVSRGKVTAKGAGMALITAAYEGATASCLVVATNYKPVKSLKLSPKKLTLALYGTQQLGLTISPADAYNPAITWTSSNPAVASVDGNGWVAGLSDGVATITATSGNGKKKSCKVTVKEVKPTEVAFAKPYLSMNPGDTFQATVKMTPEAVTNPAVTFTTSDAAVATISETGLITATGYGSATLTVTTASGGLKATCKVSVREPGAKRLAGLTIGINPGHQKKTVFTLYPIAPGSSQKAKGVKTGACGKWTRVPEYETNLAIGLKLMALLTDAGANVVITRTTNDVMLTNIDRAKMLNDAGCDVALQLHCNSISNQKAEGNSAYIRTTTEYAEVNRAIGACITEAISAECGCKNLGVKINNKYMSLNWTTTPSCLLEVGYLSNKKEDALLATDDYRNKVALGIFNGLCAYYGR